MTKHDRAARRLCGMTYHDGRSGHPCPICKRIASALARAERRGYITGWFHANARRARRQRNPKGKPETE